ncbi:MAG TPA: hypothetical protein VGM31_09390 [Puia sp.]|jgi:uncharacterized coiled-coil DUF342 family protein
MLNTVSDPQERTEWQLVQHRLDDITSMLERDMTFRQNIIDKQSDQIARLQTQLHECRQAADGTHQLVNKLLNDIEKYRKDIQWYRRTYETRSLPGTILQKLFRRRRS